MMTLRVKLGAAMMLMMSSGCSMTPPTSIHQPMTAKPVVNTMKPISDGGIFHPGANERPLFEDKRARNVGDVLTILLSEQTTGSRQSSGGNGSSSSTTASTPSVTKSAVSIFNPFSVSGSSANKSATTGTGAESQSLTGTITVTVVEILANGNLLVSGEKQVSLNQSDEFIRFSGVVNPVTISSNTVLSNQVADAHIEYKNAGEMNEVVNDAKTLGFLGRFFKSVLPY